VRPTPRQSRFLGLWTASWLFVLLVGLLLWVGDPRLQWPVLLVPVVWALVAWRRGRRGRPATVRRRDDDRARPPHDDGPWPPHERWHDEPWHDEPWPDDEPAADRRPPPTRELPWLPEVPRDRREE